MLHSRDGSNDFGIEVCRNTVPGYDCENKFGEATQIDLLDGFADVWDGAGSGLGTGKIPRYTFSTSADIDSISSSSASDTEQIKVYGLTAEWNRVDQTVTLDGQNRVALSVHMLRVYRMTNVGAADFVGDVYCYVNGDITAGVPNDASTVRAIIRSSNNRTLMAIYPIPRSMTGYLDNVYATVSHLKDQVSDIELKFRPYGGVFQMRHHCGISVSAPLSRDFKYPRVVMPRSDVVVRANTSKDGGGVAAGFSMLLTGG